MDYTPLLTPLETDPLNVGFAAHISNATGVWLGNFNACADLLNNINGTGAGTITLPTMSKADFQIAIIPAVIALASATTALQGKWDRILGMVEASDTIDCANPSIQALMSELATDGLMTSAQATAINQRKGTYAEVLCGAGAAPTGHDISIVLGKGARS